MQDVIRILLIARWRVSRSSYAVQSVRLALEERTRFSLDTRCAPSLSLWSSSEYIQIDNSASFMWNVMLDCRLSNVSINEKSNLQWSEYDSVSSDPRVVSFHFRRTNGELNTWQKRVHISCFFFFVSSLIDKKDIETICHRRPWKKKKWKNRHVKIVPIGFWSWSFSYGSWKNPIWFSDRKSSYFLFFAFFSIRNPF